MSSTATIGENEKVRLRLDVITSFSASESLQREWDEAIYRLGGPIYMTYDWLRIWWKFYGGNGDLRIFVFRNENAIVGLFPLYIARVDAGLAVCRVARLVGANVPPKAFDPPVDPAFSTAVVNLLVKRLFLKDSVDLLSFGPVSEAWGGQTGMRAALAAELCNGRASWQPHDVVTLFRLPAAFKDFVAALKKKERQTRKEKVRQLARRSEISMDAIVGTVAVAEEFERFLVQHAAQWGAVGKAGHFHSWPEGALFHRALVQAPAIRDRVMFVRLLASGQVVASRYVYRLGDRLYSELPSRAVGLEWDRLGLGTTSYFKFIEVAIGLGVTEINSGLGHYD